jgi:hypothetical protein
MATALQPRPRREDETAIQLHSGDHLDQSTFHARYERMPDDIKAELIEGVVYMPSPASRHHAEYQILMTHWLSHYRCFTPGVRAMVDGTVILDDQNEPQPDAVLLIDPEFGGRSGVTDTGFVTGSPELHVEVAYSSAAIDLHEKRQAYERGGVLEYVIYLVREQTFRFLHLDRRRYREGELDVSGVWKSSVFPGLWLDTRAVVGLDARGMLKTLEMGLASAEHAAFVKKLAAGGR